MGWMAMIPPSWLSIRIARRREKPAQRWSNRLSLSPLGGILALRAHCVLLLDYVAPEEPLDTPL